MVFATNTTKQFRITRCTLCAFLKLLMQVGVKIGLCINNLYTDLNETAPVVPTSTSTSTSVTYLLHTISKQSLIGLQLYYMLYRHIGILLHYYFNVQ